MGFPMDGLTIDDHHILSGPNVNTEFIDCAKHSGKFTLLDTLVIHYTRGGSGKGSAEWLHHGDVEASAHVVIDRGDSSGDEPVSIYQLVPFDTIAWHAGRSSTVTPEGERRDGLNRYSIGIELDNAGRLTKTGGGYQSEFGRLYPKHETFYGTHKLEPQPSYWHTFTEKQLDRLTELSRLLARRYSLRYILGHDDVAPSRKRDPGPAFPMESFSQAVLDPSRKEDEADSTDIAYVTAPRLNIRSLPSMDGKLVSAPLMRHQRMTVLDKHDGWYRVRVDIVGWVSASHVRSAVESER